VRLAELPGLGIDSAQQIIAEVGPQAAAFPSAAQLASWVGVCPGREESAGVSSSDRSAKGNRSMRRLLNQLAHAAVRKEDCQLQIVFRLSARLGLCQSGLGRCPPPLQADLESSPRWRFLRGIRTSTYPTCVKEEATEACDAIEETRIPGTTHPGVIGR
jgi:Transposase IS116/IS110/IS902 family